MENASKALLMAAGVLVGLLIISIAVFLFSDFAATSSRVHDELEQERIRQFNTQFIKYVGKESTIYDIISVINTAKDSNNYYNLTQADSSNYYITVNFKGKKQEHKNKEELDELIKADVNSVSKNNAFLKTYNCEVEINPNTKLVNVVNFTEIKK